MPRHVDRPLPAPDALLQSMREAGVTDAPTEGDEHALQGMLWMAGYLMERQKRVSFPGFSWGDPRFSVTDGKVTMEVSYAPLANAGSLRDTLIAAARRVKVPGLIGLDARASGLREFELEHLIYGQVTLFSWPHKPPEPMDRRIHEAQAKGWSRTLKTHNLLPGRGIVVLDEHGGLLLTEPALSALPGIVVLLAGGETQLWWNPFCEGLDPEMEHYLAWGAGTGKASEWREVLRYEGEAHDE